MLRCVARCNATVRFVKPSWSSAQGEHEERERDLEIRHAQCGALETKLLVGVALALGSPTLSLCAAIGFEAVAVGVDDEGRVVVLAIVGAQAGLAIVLAAGSECGLVECVNALS